MDICDVLNYEVKPLEEDSNFPRTTIFLPFHPKTPEKTPKKQVQKILIPLQ